MNADGNRSKDDSSKFWERQNLIADSPLPIREKWTLQVIFIFASASDNGRCFASNETIQRRLSLSSSQTSELIRRLERRGVITNRRTQLSANIRTINWDVLANLVNPESHKNNDPILVSPETGKYEFPDHKSENANSVKPETQIPSYRTSKRTSKVTSKRFHADQIELPDSLKTDQFQVAWREWCEYRLSRRKPISETAAKKQIEKLAECGPKESIAAIEKSIANDYTGLFPSTPKSKGESNGKSDSRTNAGQIFDHGTRGEEILA